MWTSERTRRTPQEEPAAELGAVTLGGDPAGVVLGVLLGVKLLRQPYCYIDGKPVYDKELALRTTTYFEAFEVLDAPDRLVDQLIDNH